MILDREGVVVALVAGLFGILGTTVGGVTAALVANRGANQLQAAESQRADERDARAERAAARLLVGELMQVRANVLSAGDDARWWPLDYGIHFSAADRKLLAARLPANSWQSVVTATRVLSEVPLERRDGFAWHGPHGLSDDMDTVVAVDDSTRSAVRALLPVAGAGPAVEKELALDPARVRAYRSATSHG